MRSWAAILLALSAGCARPHAENPPYMPHVAQQAPYAPSWPTLTPTLDTPGLVTPPVAPLAQPAVTPPPPLPAPAPPPAPEPEVHPYHSPIPAFTASAPALRLANLSPAACRQEAARRKLPATSVKGEVRGIANPLRLNGPLNGVRLVSAPAPSPFGMLDCRMLLALDEITAVVAPLGVREIYIGSMYRPNARIAHRPKRKSQHSYGLAMDVIAIRLEGGPLLSVDKDWHAEIGEAACGENAVMHDPTPGSIALRNTVCAIARSRICHHVITPSANRAHRDHFHCDIQRDALYSSVQ